jgi:outer membrane protein assembly factor BamB
MIIIFILFLFIGCGAIVPLTLPTQEENNSDYWLTLGRNNQHTHYSDHNVVPPLKIIWKTRVKSVITDHPLAIGDNIIALTKSGMLYQLDYETGKTLGDGTLGPAIDHVPTIQNKSMYTGFSLGKKTLIEFNLELAKSILQKAYPHISTTPLHGDEKIYFGTSKGLFLCVNAGTGEKIWDFEAKSPIQSSPTIKDQHVIFGDDKGQLFSLDATSGIKLWETTLEGNIFSHPVIDDSYVFIGTLAGNLYAIKSTNGKIIWKQKFPGAFFSSPSVYKDEIYIGNNDHKVIALNKTTGEIMWDFKTKGIVNTVPLPSPDYLYITSWDKQLYVLNRRNGNLIFKMDLKRSLKSSPIIYRDLLLVHTANGHLYALANEKYAQKK